METEARWYISHDDEVCNARHARTTVSWLMKNRAYAGLGPIKPGRLTSSVYGIVSAIHIDPIEKKPLYHFHPGSHILSLGTYGCNLRCYFCQNCSISQSAPDAGSIKNFYTPDQIIQLALQQPGNIGIAFTYNEPIVWYEYIEISAFARLAKNAGLKTVMVTNGFINKAPLNELLPLIDAFSVDLKAFSDDFYKTVTSSKLEPVKDTLTSISEAGKHLEVVNLVVPGLNDDEESFTNMVHWISGKLGKETVLHISRYFPNYKLATEATPVSSIKRLTRLAENELTYVYAGNINTGNNDTYCPKCKALLITRNFYTVQTPGLDELNRCKFCGEYFLKKT
ncbi:MAG: AmmeMemoRadiSam system radical SAM enzyme [Bacteroidales bacterium]